MFSLNSCDYQRKYVLLLQVKVIHPLSRQEKHFTDGGKEIKKEEREERRNVCVDIESVSVSAYCNRRMQKTASRNRKHLDAMGRN